MAYYHVPPPTYARYDYSTSTSTSPAPEDAYNYYVPQYSDGRTSTKRHVRTGSYTPPRVATWTVPRAYTSPGYHSFNPAYSTPPAAYYDQVSGSAPHKRPGTRRFSSSGQAGVDASPTSDKRHMFSRSQKQRISVDASGKANDRYFDSSAEEAVYVNVEPRVSRQSSTKKTRKADNYFFFSQTTNLEPDTPVRSRARRSSTASATKCSKTTKPVKPIKEPREATAADAARWGIPAGYCLKNWDSDEAPILLLGSVFNGHSLGKWIYDWTVYHHGAGTPIAEVAGEFWLLFIRFASRKRRASELLPRVRGRDNREMIREFLDAAERIWDRLQALLKSCEEFMWTGVKAKAAKGKERKVMGEKSGIEFVESFFGRDRNLERTEKAMQNMRLWLTRFDANCEEALHKSRLK